MNTSSVKADTLANAGYLDRTQNQLSQSIDRLSSGLKAVSPGDDAGEVSQSALLSGQNSQLQAASTNVQNAMSYLQVADGGVSNMDAVLSRMSELTTLTSDPTKSAGDIANYQSEFSQLQSQLRDTIGGTTAQIGGTFDVTDPSGSFNGIALFGSNSGMTVQVGDDPADKVTIPQSNLQTGAMLTLIQQDSSGNFTFSLSSANANTAVTAGIQSLTTTQGQLASASAGLNLAATSLTAETQNSSAAISGLQDVDVAAESTRLAKYHILTQASTAMLAQENLDPKAVLALLH